jgi:hypothetical protein
MRFTVPWRTLRHFLNHPLGRRNRLGTLMRILRWQIGSRALGTAVAVPFVDGTRLLIRAGMHGATGNVYVGLMEYEDMAFVLHLLRKDDAFLDVGANVGVYSILAAGRGANVLAIEPVPATYGNYWTTSTSIDSITGSMPETWALAKSRANSNFRRRPGRQIMCWRRAKLATTQ